MFFVLLLFSLCEGCKNNSDSLLDGYNERLQQINQTWKGAPINIKTLLQIDSIDIESQTPYTILVYYNADCSICISALKEWNQNLVPFFSKINTPIKFILATDDKRMLHFYLKQMEFSGDYALIAKQNKFLEKFTFADEGPFNTFLINQKKEIEFIGSPLLSNNLKKYYAKRITEE